MCIRRSCNCNVKYLYVEVKLKRKYCFCDMSELVCAEQCRTQEFCSGGGSTNSVEDRGNGDLGAVAP